MALTAAQQALLDDRELMTVIKTGSYEDKDSRLDPLYKAFQKIEDIKEFIKKIDSLQLSEENLNKLVREMATREGDELGPQLFRQTPRLGKYLAIYQAERAGFGAGLKDLAVLNDPVRFSQVITQIQVPPSLVKLYQDIIIPRMKESTELANSIARNATNNMRFNILGTIVQDHFIATEVPPGEWAIPLKKLSNYFDYSEKNELVPPVSAAIDFNARFVNQTLGAEAEQTYRTLMQGVMQKATEKFSSPSPQSSPAGVAPVATAVTLSFDVSEISALKTITDKTQIKAKVADLVGKAKTVEDIKAIFDAVTKDPTVKSNL